jgi:hypothetical protein
VIDEDQRADRTASGGSLTVKRVSVPANVKRWDENLLTNLMADDNKRMIRADLSLLPPTNCDR